MILNIFNTIHTGGEALCYCKYILLKSQFTDFSIQNFFFQIVDAFIKYDKQNLNPYLMQIKCIFPSYQTLHFFGYIMINVFWHLYDHISQQMLTKMQYCQNCLINVKKMKVV